MAIHQQVRLKSYSAFHLRALNCIPPAHHVTLSLCDDPDKKDLTFATSTYIIPHTLKGSALSPSPAPHCPKLCFLVHLLSPLAPSIAIIFATSFL
jgi:hypothetical protein